MKKLALPFFMLWGIAALWTLDGNLVAQEPRENSAPAAEESDPAALPNPLIIQDDLTHSSGLYLGGAYRNPALYHPAYFGWGYSPPPYYYYRPYPYYYYSYPPYSPYPPWTWTRGGFPGPRAAPGKAGRK
jgi:hypothetical protein